MSVNTIVPEEVQIPNKCTHGWGDSHRKADNYSTFGAGRRSLSRERGTFAGGGHLG